MKLVNRFCFCLFLSSLFFTNIDYSQNQSSFSFPVSKKESKPWTYWWWMGNAVDSLNITYNLEKFAEAGIGGVHIIPIYGVKGYEDKFIDFLSPKWMDMLSFTWKECKRLGVGLDMTLGTGWPFGGTQVSAKYSSAHLINVSYNVKSNSLVKFNILEEAKRKAEDKLELKVLAVNAYSKKGRVDLTKNVNENGMLIWKSTFNECEIIALVLTYPTQQVKRAAPGGKGNVVDPFSTEALNDYLSSFDKAFANYNYRMIRAFYHDSYEYFDANWTNNYLKEFEQRRGYNLLNVLPQFLCKTNNDTTARIKSDYRFTIAELHDEFIRRTTEWANKKNALFRDQAHGSPTNLLDTYAASDIPEAEVFGAPKVNIPGLNYDTAFTREETVDPLILKFASSAAHITGKNLVSSETGTWLTEHFRESLSLIKPEIDLLFTSGINHIFFHGIPYSPKEEEWPGWQFYASTNFGPTNSIWYDIPSLTNYIARCQSILQKGKPDNDLLIYFPIWDLWHSSKEGLINLKMHNPEEWLFNTNFYNTSQKLNKYGYTFDYISDKQIETLCIKNGKIFAGSNEYKAIIIPPCRFMPVETLQKLKELINCGMKIIFIDHIPSDVPGFNKYEERQKELKNIGSQIVQSPEKKRNNVLIGEDVVVMVNQIGVKRESISDFDINFIRRKCDDGRYYFISNQQSIPLNNWVKLTYPAESIVIMNPLNGQAGLAQTKVTSDGSTSVFLQVDPGASLILNTLDKKIKGNDWIYIKPTGKEFEINGEWEVKFIQGGPNLPGNTRINKLESWTVFGDDEAKRFAGTAEYRIKFKNPDPAVKNWIIDLGEVHESARIKINGHNLGTIWSFPFKLSFNNILNKAENELEIEVTNLSANRIKDLDTRGVDWKKFYDVNFVNVHYKKFDASTWDLVDSGLLGPVKLLPAEEIK